jgi:hypothetical protein
MKTIDPKGGSIISMIVLIMVFCYCQTVIAGNPPQATDEKSVVTGQGVDEAFMAKLTGKPREEKLTAIRQNSIRQYDKNKTLREKNYQQSLSKYKANLQTGSMVRRGIIESRLAALDRNFNELQEFIAAKHQETLAFIDKLKADPTPDGAALDQALREFFKSQKEAVQKRSEEYLQKQREIHMQGRKEAGAY